MVINIWKEFFPERAVILWFSHHLEASPHLSPSRGTPQRTGPRQEVLGRSKTWYFVAQRGEGWYFATSLLLKVGEKRDVQVFPTDSWRPSVQGKKQPGFIMDLVQLCHHKECTDPRSKRLSGEKLALSRNG